jgi:hypothetical protein
VVNRGRKVVWYFSSRCCSDVRRVLVSKQTGRDRGSAAQDRTVTRGPFLYDLKLRSADWNGCYVTGENRRMQTPVMVAALGQLCADPCT